jgi:hypothetical protein
MPKLRRAMQALPSRDAATSFGHRRRRSALGASLVWPFGLRSSGFREESVGAHCCFGLCLGCGGVRMSRRAGFVAWYTTNVPSFFCKTFSCFPCISSCMGRGKNTLAPSYTLVGYDPFPTLYEVYLVCRGTFNVH